MLPEQGFHVACFLVGTESTCALIVEAVISLAESPRHRRLVVLGYNDVYTAADHVPALLEHDLLGLEGFDETLIEQMRAARLNIADLELLPPGGGWLIAEVGAADETEAEVRVCCPVDIGFGRSERGAVLRCCRAAGNLANPRVGARRDGATSGAASQLRGVGGCRRGA